MTGSKTVIYTEGWLLIKILYLKGSRKVQPDVDKPCKTLQNQYRQQFALLFLV